MELVRGLPNLRQFKDLGSVRLQSVIAELRRRKRWLRVGHVEEAPGDDDAAPAKEHFDMILQYQTSSLGDLSLSHWLRSFCYLAAGRLEPPPPKTVETQKRGSETTRRRKRQRVQIQRDEGFDLGIDDVLDPPTPPIAPKPFTLPITVVYPTQQHVVEMAKRGVVGGGTMMKEDQWEKPHFPKACLRTCESKRVAFMHSKILLAKLVEVDGVGNGDGEVCRMMNCELGAVLEVDENGVLVGEEDGNWLDADDGKGKGKGRILLEDEMKREVRIPVEAVLMHSVARPYADRDVPWMPEKWRKEQGKGTPVSEEV
ncbi:hypothetical protein HK097_004209 [Rhizophlyctis rosea]|uniref:Uncharacterized protein n=1 Tax=Rhizophlyctis rosea TaxID=64517 RepID=A0AAD5X6J7_9FUNG|nr:hypothetical protein HK097_004209 [Rhizophlyctis rosea]